MSSKCLCFLLATSFAIAGCGRADNRDPTSNNKMTAKRTTDELLDAYTTAYDSGNVDAIRALFFRGGASEGEGLDISVRIITARAGRNKVTSLELFPYDEWLSNHGGDFETIASYLDLRPKWMLEVVTENVPDEARNGAIVWRMNAPVAETDGCVYFVGAKVVK